MTKEKLEAKLNEEYKNIGAITIGDFTEQVIDINSIVYVKDIMDKIEALESDEPIVVVKHSWKESYEIIDGYHRVKDKLDRKEISINAFVLERHSIKRKADTLFNFLGTFIGKKVVFLSNDLLVADGEYYQIVENEGCGGCSSGWSSFSVFEKYINKPLVIKTIENDGKEERDEYKLIINGEHIADIDTGWGNGYYGGDFEVNPIV